MKNFFVGLLFVCLLALVGNLIGRTPDTGGQAELLCAANSNADIQAETLLRVPKEE